MNGNRIAGSIVIGFIISMLFAFTTREANFRYEEPANEKVKYQTNTFDEGPIKLIRKEIFEYNYYFITISFISGTALGYLICGKFFSKK